jgi:phage terminase small subunit
VPRKRDPNRDKAYEVWKKANGDITNRAIAEQLGVPEKTIGGWKSKDKWNQKLNGVLQTKIRSTPNKKPSKKARSPNNEKSDEPIVESGELTDKQRLFCIYYVKSFNQTMAAIKAGYAPESAHVRGSELVRNSKVAAEIRRIKGKMTSELFLDAMDVLNKYVKIAFADITDYLSFGRKEVTDINPVTGKEHKFEVNYVDFKDSGMIDGTIVSEVKQGKDGVSIKLADKMKALEKLSLYFDLFPDNFKREIEEEKLKMAHHKVFGSDEPDEYEDDGFEGALNATTSEVWSDDDSDEEEG